ncbi:MAG: ubiquitin-like protein Pup [Actinomycetia bacterium]|nr:ubiquitin-like protein Pup [Actinomycetes bacterium]
MPTHHDQARPARQIRDQEPAETAPTTEASARRDQLAEDVDALLDDIDEVLEANAEDFVRGFVQKGGQ